MQRYVFLYKFKKKTQIFPKINYLCFGSIYILV